MSRFIKAGDYTINVDDISTLEEDCGYSYSKLIITMKTGDKIHIKDDGYTRISDIQRQIIEVSNES